MRCQICNKNKADKIFNLISCCEQCRDKLEQRQKEKQRAKKRLCENCGCELAADEEGWCDDCNLPERSVGLL